MNMFHLSPNNLDGKTLKPRIPSNYFTNNGFEDNKIKRVSFSKNLDGALMALGRRVKGEELYVHIPDGKYEFKIPSTDQVPDSKITSEIWVIEDVKLKCIGKIKVIDDAGEDGLQFNYGKNKGYLYKWNWKWLNKTHLNESVDIITEELMIWINQ